jgi:hypothetical protein
MSISTLSEHICASESAIENWVKMGVFPKPRMQGGKRLWSWKVVERHLAGESAGASDAPSDLTGRIRDATRQALQRQDH